MRPEASDDELVARRYGDEDRSVLLRYLRLADSTRFQLAAVEVSSSAERTTLIGWLHRNLPEKRWREVSLRAPVGQRVAETLNRALEEAGGPAADLVLVWTDLEEVAGAIEESHPAVFMELNLQRDQLVREVPVVCLLCAHPAAMLKLRLVAPDFCDYFSALVRLQPEAPAAGEGRASFYSLGPSASLGLSESDWPSLLREADQALQHLHTDELRDRLAQFRMSSDAADWALEAELIDVIDVTSHADHVSRLVGALHRADGRGRPATLAKFWMLLGANYWRQGDVSKADESWAQSANLFDSCSSSAGKAEVQLWRARAMARRGDLKNAMHSLADVQSIFHAHGKLRGELVVLFEKSSILGRQGKDIEVEKLCIEEILPTAQRLGDLRMIAHGRGLLANVLETRGALQEALRIRREEELPVYSALGDLHSWAITYWQMAGDHLQSGQVHVALEMIRDKALPALLQIGSIGDIALARRDLGRCLLATGRRMEAVRELDLSRELFEREDLPREVLKVRILTSQVLWQSNDRSGAARELRAALQRAEATSDPALLVTVANHLLPRLVEDQRTSEARQVLDHLSTLLSTRGQFIALDSLAPWESRLSRASSAAPNRRARRRSRSRRP
ncbi:MAG: hypothetical protein Q8S73_22220 [Deltaproteobacteria bacterium]|nr:hypothetical protein [Myxococcales bacterium]MDP3216842.1 hypothetical protein [Deltaproteobacteria bacterium]